MKGRLSLNKSRGQKPTTNKSLFDGAALQNGMSGAISWPVAQTKLVSAKLPPNDYHIAAMIGTDIPSAKAMVYTDKGWVEFDAANETVKDKGTPVHVEAGKTVELVSNGLE